MVNSLIRLFSTTAPDFQVLYLAAKDLLTTSNPYLNSFIFTGVGYPPNTLLFYLPLTLFNYQTSQNIFTVLSLLSLLLTVVFIFNLLKQKKGLFLLLLVLFLSLISFPTKFTLGMGQNNFFALLLLIISFYFFDRKKLVKAGLFLGLAFSLKTIFAYFLILFLVKKQWKVVFYSLVVFLTTALVVWIIRGSLDLYVYYFQNVLPPLFDYASREIYYNQGISGFVSRIFADIFSRKVLTTLLSLSVVFINVYFLLKRKTNEDNFIKLASLTTISLLLIDSLAWQHHFVWLIFPLLVLWKYTFGYFVKILLSAAVILVSINVPEMPLLSSHVFVGTLILYLINLKLLKR